MIDAEPDVTARQQGSWVTRMQENEESKATSSNEHLTQLFAETRNGNRSAFDELYDAIRKPLMAYCLAVTTSTDDAKDLFSITMLKMYEARDRFVSGNFEAWLFTIARNAARTEFRNRKRRPSVNTVEDLPSYSDRGLEEEDEAEHVRKAILQLPEEFRTVIMLKYFADMGVADIAESEGISTELVKTRLYRARIKLAAILRHLVEEES